MTPPPEDSAGAPDPFAGKVLDGRWRLVERLGAGGMGAVYLAEDLRFSGRKLAVKLLLPEFARSAEFVKRFRAEAKRAAAISHPRVVMVLDFGKAETGELFIAMEYVVGDTLSSLMREGPLPLARAIAFGVQLAEALHEVHEAGIVHRDVKPANVMIRKGSDDLKLMDFGVSRALDDDAEHTHITRTGVAVGTPAFMAPEQIAGGAISRQTDVYAFGVVLYAMLAGKRPFEASSPTVVQYQHVHEPPPPLRTVRPEVPEVLERIVLRALEKRPENRQRSMIEVAAALRAVEAGCGEGSGSRASRRAPPRRSSCSEKAPRATACCRPRLRRRPPNVPARRALRRSRLGARAARCATGRGVRRRPAR